MISTTAVQILDKPLVYNKYLGNKSMFYLVFAGHFLACFSISFFVLSTCFYKTNINSLAICGLLIATLASRKNNSLITSWSKKLANLWKIGIYSYQSTLKAMYSSLLQTNELKPMLGRLVSNCKQIFQSPEVYCFLFSPNMIFNKNKELTPLDDFYSPGLIEFLTKKNKVITHQYADSMLQSKQICAEEKTIWNEIKSMYDRYQIAVTVPLVHNQQLIGTISLGQKINQSDYSTKDIKVLQEFSRLSSPIISRARLDQEIKKRIEHLGHQLGGLTQEIKELKQKQASVLSNLAHELQSPLSVVVGEIDLLPKEKISCKILKPLESSVNRMTSAIAETLYLAQLEFDTDFQNIEKVDISKLIDNFCEYFKILAKEQKIVFQKHIYASLLIHGKTKQLEELITRLISQIVKSMEKRKCIELVLEQKEKKACLIIITDKEFPEKMKMGTNWSICKKIIQNHGGEIILSKDRELTIKFPII